MLRDTTWNEAVAQAEHRVAIGATDVYLGDREDGIDWSLCTDVNSGGSHRLDMDTTLYFTFTHPSGLSFRWYFELEEGDANGRGYYKIRSKEIVRVLTLLPLSVREKFVRILQEDADKVQAKADELMGYVEKQYAAVGVLRRLAEKAAS